VRAKRLFATLTVSVLVTLGACSGDGGTEDEGTPTTEAQPGGTLRLGAVKDCRAACDPQRQQDQFPTTLFDCCLLRTLVKVEPAPEGPTFIGDISEDPVVSDDGLEFEFTLREGVRFGPPIDRPVTAEDFIATFERALSPATEAFDAANYRVIEGAEEFAAGEAPTISGLEAPSPNVLRIRLSEAAPLFLPNLASVSAAPIPPELMQGHAKDYGRFLVSTGPYMVEGIDAVDVSGQQEPASGYRPGQALVLVRNPAWDRASDPIRGDYAYPDSVEVTIGGSVEDYSLKIDRGELDMQIDGTPPASALRRYSTDEALQARVVTEETAAVVYSTMTVAAPPFDDEHVRRAVNWIVDKSAVIRLIGGPLNGTVAHHVFPNVSIGGALADYRPFGTANDAGDPERAMEEMAQSAYDSDGDGRCDAPECTGVIMLGSPESPGAEIAQSIADDLEAIGLEIDVQLLENRYELLDEPSNRVPMNTWAAWGTAPYDPSEIAGPVFHSEFIGPKACCNEVLLGATPSQLDGWGFASDSVPSVDADIEACDQMPLGQQRSDCWVALNQRITEMAVWIPLYEEKITRIVSENVVAAPWSPLYQFIAFEQVSLSPDG